MGRTDPQPHEVRRSAIRITAIYAVTATAWIALSDHIMGVIIPNPLTLTELQTIKGALFVAVTSGLLLALIRRDLGRLHQAEQRYRTMFEAAPVGIAISQQGVTTYANPSYLRLFGYDDPAELYGTPFLNQIAPERRAALIEQNRQREAGGAAPTVYETVGLRKDGALFPFQNHVARIDLPEGPSTVVFASDITERKRAATQIRQQSARAGMLAEISRALAEVSLDHRALLTTMVQRTAELVGDGCAIRLLSEDRQWLTAGVSYHRDPAARAFIQQTLATTRHRSDEGLHGQVLQRGQTILLPLEHSPQPPEVIKPEYWSYVERFGAHAILIAPLRASGQVIGTLTLLRDRTPEPFTDDDQLFVQELADRAALAVEQARLFAAAQAEIVERRRTEAVLRRSEATNRALLDAIPDAMFRMRRDGVYLDYKPAKEYRSLVPPDAFIGQRVDAVMPSDLAQQTMRAIEQAMGSGETQVLEYQLWMDGVLSEYEARLVGSGDDEVVALVRDITERKRMERTMRDARDVYLTLVEEAPMLVWRTNRDDRFDFFNKQWLAFTGRTLEQAVAGALIDRIHRDDRDAARETFAAARSEERRFESEYRLLRHDGVYRWVVCQVTPFFDEYSQFAGYIGTCLDIEERKRQEQMKDDFLALASHELKTPLAALIGYVHLLDRWLHRQPVEPRMRQALSAMASEGTRLDRLINDLLDVSRIGSDRLRIHTRPVDLTAIVQQSIGQARVALGDHPLLLESMEDGPMMINADALRIEQVLANLLTNAAKYSPRELPVCVRLRRSGDYAEIIVRDRGVGIPPEDLPYIFDRFYQVPRPARESRPGLGLGLYIADEIVRQHGGTISVESVENQGSNFIVRLPLHDQLAEESSADAAHTTTRSA